MRTIRNKHYENEDKKVFKPIIKYNFTTPYPSTKIMSMW